MRETELYQMTKNKLSHWEWDRVESHLNSGQPDTVASHGYKCHRIELKVMQGTTMWFEPSQISWVLRMNKANVWNVWVIAYHVKKDTPYIFPYRYVPDLVVSVPKQKKYRADIVGVPMSYSGWDNINDALRYNYGR